jgi:drug/metabolite transporter (DMT)-like permease
MTGQRHAAPRDPARPGAGRRRPPRNTATWILLLVAVVGSVAYVAFALTNRDEAQVPMLASGAAVLGLVFAALALAGAISTIRAARADQPGRSVILAIIGGAAGMIAFGCFAVAVVLALLWRSP